jgi:hypothetical protein
LPAYAFASAVVEVMKDGDMGEDDYRPLLEYFSQVETINRCLDSVRCGLPCTMIASEREAAYESPKACLGVDRPLVPPAFRHGGSQACNSDLVPSLMRSV